VLAAYAAVWEREIGEVIAVRPPAGHMDAAAPAVLNVLRVCDIPEVFGLLRVRLPLCSERALILPRQRRPGASSKA